MNVNRGNCWAILVVLMGTASAGVAWAAPNTPVKPNPAASQTWRADQTDPIFETSLRYMFGHNATALNSMADAYYIMLPVGDGMGDPSDAFLTRFAKDDPPVKRGSDCTTNGSVAARGSGEAGLLFFVEDVAWTDDNDVSVEGGYEEDIVSAARVTCLLQFKKGHWKVTKYSQRLPHSAAPPH